MRNNNSPQVRSSRLPRLARPLLCETLESRRLLSVEGPVLLDGGLEFPVQPDNAFKQAQGAGTGSLIGAQWTISDGAGITRNLSPFQSGNIPAPEGDQHGLIENSGSFQQTVSGFVVGREYSLSLLTMARQYGDGGSDLEVILDLGLASEISLIDIPEVTFSAFTEISSPTFMATKSSYVLTIDSDNDEGNLSGDRTTFFDDVQFDVFAPMGLIVPSSGPNAGRLTRYNAVGDSVQVQAFGVNYYDAFDRYLQDINDRSFEEGFDYLAEHSIPVARVMAGGYWPSEWSLYFSDKSEYYQRFDDFVATAEQRGIGLIPSLFFHIPTVGELVDDAVAAGYLTPGVDFTPLSTLNTDTQGNDTYAEYLTALGRADSGSNAFITYYTNEVVSRYQDSPAIWGWEFSNEINNTVDLPNINMWRPKEHPVLGMNLSRDDKMIPAYTSPDDFTRADVDVAKVNFANTVRAIDPWRFLSTGDSRPRPYAYHNWQEHSWTLDTRTELAQVLPIDNPNPYDSVSFHLYADNNETYFEDSPQVSIAWETGDYAGLLEFFESESASLGQPLFVGEFGAIGDGTTTGERTTFHRLMQALMDENVQLSLLWDFDNLNPGHEFQWWVNPNTDKEYQLTNSDPDLWDLQQANESWGVWYANTAPIAVDDLVSTSEDDAILINVLADNGNGPDFDAEWNIDPTETVNLSSPGLGTLINNNDGTFTYDPNGTFDYLAAGSSEIVFFEYRIKDADGEDDTATVTITINGVNDAPIISDGPDSADFDVSDSMLSATGTLTISDVDTSDVVTASVDSLVISGTSDRLDPMAPSDTQLLSMLSVTPTDILDGTENSDTLSWNFNSGSEHFNYMLLGQTLVLTYTVGATDDDAIPLSDIELITITITGTNSAPTASITGPSSGVPFQDRTFTLTATDSSPADQAAGFFFDIDWDGDDEVDQTVIGLSGTQVTHAYNSVGAKTVKVTARDQFNAVSDVSTHAVNIARIEMQGGDLVWGGTAGEDAVEFEETASQTVEIRATLLNGVVVSETQTFGSVTGRVIAFGGDSDDIIDAGGVDGLTNISATLIGGLGHDTIYGGDAADTILGLAGDDKLYGNDGNDHIAGFDGGEGGPLDDSDQIFGGLGNDTLSGDKGTDTVHGGSGNDMIYGDGDPELENEGAADLLLGEDGDDTINGGPGDDQIDGGDGNDLLVGGDGAEGVAGGDDFLTGGEGNDTIEGDNGQDFIIGGQGDDSLVGGDGNDVYIFERSGTEDLGTDQVVEETGADNDPFDILIFEDFGAAVDVDLSDASEQEVHSELSIDLNGSDVVEIASGSVDFDDTLTGNSRDNVLVGHGGDDQLFGDSSSATANRDFLIGGAGADTIQGLAGDDLIIAGATDYGISNQIEPHLAVFSEWLAAKTYEDRVDNIIGASGAPDPLPSADQLADGVSVFDDSEIDSITGGSGDDFYFADLDPTIEDVLTDKAIDELVEELDTLPS